MMNPQILIDGVEHGVRGMIVIFDNRRMAAITGLQMAQYGAGFRTNDRVAVDYVRLAGAVAGVNAVHGGWTADELKSALQGRARPRRPLRHPRAGLCRRPRACRPRRLGPVERRQLVRGRAARVDGAGSVALPLSPRIATSPQMSSARGEGRGEGQPHTRRWDKLPPLTLTLSP